MHLRTGFFLAFVLSVNVCFGQKQYYMVGDSIFNETRIRFVIDSLAETLLINNYSLQPTVYNKVIKMDSVINYLAFKAVKNESKSLKKNTELIFKQDSLYLNLNKRLPGFTLNDLKDKEFSSSGLAGKPTLIVFWSIYCPPCIASFPYLNTLKTTYGDRMNFIAIADGDCGVGAIEDLLREKPFNYNVLKKGDAYKKLLNIGAVPKYIFVDRQGYVRYIQTGLPLEKDLSTNEWVVISNKHFQTVIERMLK